MLTKIKTLRPTYAYIDLENYKHNIEIAKKLSNSKIIAIVKADAYGHGAIKIAEFAYKQCGVTHFGVATIEEGINLRKKLNDAHIIILGYVDEKYYDEILANNLILTIYDYNFASSFNNYLISKNRVHPAALKIDTGMNRLGFNTDLNYFELSSTFSNIKFVLCMTHLSSSDTDREYTEFQINMFKDFLKREKINIPTSVLNSSAICLYKNDFDYTRPGIMTYGYVYPENSFGLKPVMKIFSKIVHVKELKRGDKVSYNQKFTADKKMKIGVVPIGYADGYFRNLSNRGFMYINGKRCNVVGSVCMDMTMIDISHLTENEITEEVEILGENVRADMLAELCDTISYEILCAISDRIPRVYSNDY
ncbi:alanine racemase [Deferribacter autotrophicus]|uniref:Alanine racemase n=1 Tax=Deferribacter autotrophicus TaxID=500465 RepID=A0A5A8F394_9BACT|nr:alanine racemase [Deferribacter autotrophicus]KAA0257421.1 alanine racemase [Deferribacter autotrophicus]